MAAEVASGAVEGAKAGAVIGSAVPVIGTVAGAIVGGVIGAIGGFFSNKKKKKSKRAAREAANISRKQQAMQLALQRRDIFRNARLNRAQAVNVGGNEGRTINSGTQGVAGAVEASLTGAIDYFDTQVQLDYTANEFRKKAGKYAGQAADINTALGSLNSAATLGANIYGSFKTPGAGTAGTSSPGSTPPFVGPR